MDNFHRRLVASVSVTAALASSILTVSRDKKSEISLEVSSKDSSYRADKMAERIVADIISKEKTTKQVYFANEQVDTMKDVSMPQTFLSNNRHSSTTAEDISNIWGLSISQAAINLKETTQKLTRSALMTLAQRYRADQMFDFFSIHGTMSTNTMDARCQLIHDENYCKVFGNKQLFVESYPIKKKSDCHLGLDRFVKEFGSPENMTHDDTQEQIGKYTDFQRVMRKYEIKGPITETKRLNQMQ